MVEVVECGLWTRNEGKVVKIEEGANDTDGQNQALLSDDFSLTSKATILLQLQPVEGTKGA